MGKHLQDNANASIAGAKMPPKRPLTYCCVFVILMFVAPPSAAAENLDLNATTSAEQNVTLGTSTVYAARREQSDQEVVFMVGVADAADADLAQAANVGDFLDDVSGIRLLDDVSGNEQRIYIRGFEEDQTMVLIDGRRQNMTTRDEGRFYLDPELLQSAEVVKGAHSASYGGGAMAGVVAFETKSVDDLLGAGDDSALRTSLGYRGASLEVAPAVTGALRTDRLDFLINASGRNSGNIQQGDGSELYTDDQMASALFKSNYNASSYKLGLEAHVHSNNGRQADENEDDDATELSISDYQYSLRYQAFGMSNPLLNPKAHLYMNDTSYELEDLAGDSEGRVRGRDYSTMGATVDYQHQLGAIQQLAYGVEFYQDEQDGYDNSSSDGDRDLTPDGEATFSGIYFQDEVSVKVGVPNLKIEKLLKFIAALRYDTFAYAVDGINSSGSQVSPKLGFALSLNPALDFFMSWARAYRPPIFHEISGGGTSNYSILPNEYLDPETITTIELGLAYEGQSNANSFSIEGVVYNSSSDNYIDEQTVSDSEDDLVLQYANVNSAIVRGFEIDGKFRQRALALSASIASTRAKDGNTGDYLEGNNVPLTLKTNLSYQIGSGTWGLRSIFVDEDDGYSDEEEHVPSYSVFDLYYSWPSSGELNGLRFNSGVSNILGESYSKTSGGTIEEGTSYNFKLSYQW